MYDKSTVERFKSKIVKTHCGCWVWIGALNGWGYGNFSIWDKRTKKARYCSAHRVAWQIKNGPIPENMELDHYVCQVKACVNPDHLRPCSSAENIKRPDGGAGKQMAKTHCSHGHEFNEENTGVTKTGWRRCRECARVSAGIKAMFKRAGYL